MWSWLRAAFSRSPALPPSLETSLVQVGDRGLGQRTAGDGLQNVVAGLGTSRDKRYYTQHVLPDNLSPMQLQAMFRGSWLARRIVTTPADDMTRAWVKVSWEGYDADEGGARAVERAEATFNLRGAVNSATRWGRLYGGCTIVIIIKGDKDLSQPLDLNLIKKGSLARLHVIDRHRINATGGLDFDDPSSPNFGLPKFYILADSMVRVHWTRVVRFNGQELPHLLWLNNDYWHDSVLMSPLDSIKNYETATGGAASMVWEANVDILKMQGLAEQLSNKGGEDGVTARLINAMIMKSFNRTLVLDKDTEDYTQKSIAFGGLTDVIGNFVTDLCGAADIPATRLFGMSPAGLNATGESDLRNYYDHISSRQETNLRPQLERLYEVVIRSTIGRMPENFKVTFNPLWQVSDKEKADIAKIRADTDVIYLTNGILDEGAIARELKDRGTYLTMDEVEVELAESLSAAPAAADPEDEADPDADPAAAPAGAPNIGLTPSAQGAIITVNEARRSIGLGPLTNPETGKADPDGDLTIAAYQVKHAATTGGAAQVEGGETNPGGGNGKSNGKPETPPPVAKQFDGR